MNLIDIYTNILEDAGLLVEPNGFVVINNEKFGVKEKNAPVLIDGKRLAIPTNEQLADSNPDKINFHPLSESHLRGESMVVAKLRTLFTTRLNFTVAILAQHLIDICASVNRHKNLTPDQSEVLLVAPDCDEVTTRNFSSLIVKLLDDQSSFIRFYLKRAGIVKGDKYARAGIVSFPFFEELSKEQDTYFGIKLRKKDRSTIINIFKYILKNIDKPEAYNKGSDSDIAPFMDALMRTFYGIASEINDIIVKYAATDEIISSLAFNFKWREYFDDLNMLSKEIRRIPPQLGNEGESRKTESAIGQNTQAANLDFVAPQPIQQSQATPVNQPPVTQSKPEEGKVSFSDLLNKSHQPQAQYQPTPQMYNPGFAQPPMNVPASMMGAVQTGQWGNVGFNNMPPPTMPNVGMTPNQVLMAGMQNNQQMGGYQQNPSMGGFGQSHFNDPTMPRSRQSLPNPTFPGFNNGYGYR